MKNTLLSDLNKNIRGPVRFDSVTRHQYSTDASMYQIQPLGVVVPEDEADMQVAAEIAFEHLVPVLPRGGGTSLAGQCVGEALVLDVSTRLNKILDLNVEEGWVKVQPGVVQDQLNAHLGRYGFLFGPDTATSNRATIGGMAGNNSAGARSILYGKTVDHVLEVEATLSNGAQVVFKELDETAWAAKLRLENLEGHIYRAISRIADENRKEVKDRFPSIMRRVSGYNLDEMIKTGNRNLAKLLVGSEGTLALSRSLKLKISPLPKSKGLLVVHFKNMLQAVEADEVILEFAPSAAELVDNTIINQAIESPLFHGKTGFVEGRPGAIVIVEFYGETKAEVDDKLIKLEARLKKEKMGYAHVKALEPSDQALVWNLRKGGLGLMMGTRSEAKPIAFVEDTAVDPAKLPKFLKSFEAVVKKHGTTAGYYGHCSVGCLHIRPFIDMKQPAERKKMMAIFEDITALVEEYGGSMSGEHGDGLARSWLNERLFGKQLYGAFQDIKAAFDPHGLLNPGKVVDGPSPVENLRLGDHYKDMPIETTLDFSREGGFNFAVEMCNGNGQCRKLGQGVMCPSFQATGDDRHSTRGRANALRGVIGGALPKGALNSRELYEVMDMCLACKGCKSECPSEVDMAKMKYEFLHQYHKANGVPLRDRMFANAEALGRVGSAWWPLSSLAMRGPFKKLGMKMLGMAHKREMITFARRRFSKWFKSRKKSTENRPEVVLFHDTFVEYHYPQLGRSAVEILEHAGYEVVLVDKKCCGRPMISKGLLDEAKVNALHNVAQLKPYVERGVPVVGVEPSCILTLAEDYRDLIPSPDTEAVADAVQTMDQFLEGLIAQGKLNFGEGKQEKTTEYLFHGHCHQKALVGTSHALAVLKSLPGANVKEIDSGCCGMAGSFGYEKEHYEVSIAIGEQRLFPAVRGAAPDSVVVADGLSCRQQIKHGTSRKALHLVEVVAKML